MKTNRLSQRRSAAPPKIKFNIDFFCSLLGLPTRPGTRITHPCKERKGGAPSVFETLKNGPAPDLSAPNAATAWMFMVSGESSAGSSFVSAPSGSSSSSPLSSTGNSSLYQASSPREVSGTPRGSITTCWGRGSKVVRLRLEEAVCKVEKESGGSVVDLVGKEETHPLHERDLDRIRVFEDGQVEGVTRTAGTVGVELDASLLPALVEVA